MDHFQTFSVFLLMLLLITFNVSRALDCQSNDSNPYKVAYTIVVDQSGKGNFTNIQKAIDSIPPNNTKWIRIQISRGVYQEKVTIANKKPCVFLEGAGSRSTIVEWGDHETTSTSATFTVYPENIVVKGITFKNTYNVRRRIDLNKPRRLPAVAARSYGDKSAFYYCSFIGLQDTLLDAKGRHYFNNCYIEGAVDFIFGSGQSIYEQCAINLNMGRYISKDLQGFITAQRRNSSEEPSGFVFKNCTFTGTGKALLGRAWGGYSRVIIANSELSDIIAPQGWDAWSYVGKEQNIYYAEAGCRGPGADTSKRVSWEKKQSDTDLNRFVNISFIDHEGWIQKLPKIF